MSYINDVVKSRIKLAVSKVSYNNLPINPSWSDRVCHAIVYGVIKHYRPDNFLMVNYAEKYLDQDYLSIEMLNSFDDKNILSEVVLSAAQLARSKFYGFETSLDRYIFCLDLVEEAVHLLGQRPS